MQKLEVNPKRYTHDISMKGYNIRGNYYDDR